MVFVTTVVDKVTCSIFDVSQLSKTASKASPMPCIKLSLVVRLLADATTRWPSMMTASVKVPPTSKPSNI